MASRSFGALMNRFRIGVRIAKGHVVVSPDPATIDRNTLVDWEIEMPEGVSEINVEIYFDKGKSPLEWSSRKGTSTSLQSIKPRSLKISGLASEPGDYKYGIRAYDLSEGRLLADDDPRLIVR